MEENKQINHDNIVRITKHIEASNTLDKSWYQYLAGVLLLISGLPGIMDIMEAAARSGDYSLLSELDDIILTSLRLGLTVAASTAIYLTQKERAAAKTEIKTTEIELDDEYLRYIKPITKDGKARLAKYQGKSR